MGSTEVTEADEKILKFLVGTKSLLLHEKEKYICCGSILSLVQILFSFVFGYGNNGNRTEWSPIRSVIIRVINKIGRPRSGSPICLITSMITDRIGRHEVLLPINHNFNKICDI